MDKQQALKQLRIMQAWHEDNGDGPNADYDAICAGIAALETQEYYEKLITALETEHAKPREMQKAQPEIITCAECETLKRSECLWHNAGATYCSFAERRTDG